MRQELEKTYKPSKYEGDVYRKWEESGFFNPDNLDLEDNSRSYTIILPPPNITDKLHMGHAATLAIEDLLIRYHRLLGERTLWLPGTDHAAIATQNVVEKRLFNDTGKTRHDLGKEAFLEEVWDFLKITQNTILQQIKRMGASLDWSRLAFTLDDQRKLAVRTMFKNMYDEGIIYRGERIVNWCPHCHSTLSNDEIEYNKQNTKLYTFRYSKDFPISISTTRPETKIGDTAIAVNPKDKRYKKYIGKEFKIDFVGQKLKIKVIEDYNVDMNFGTGALGVTPAHSMVDWQMAEKENLDIIKVINEEGKIMDGFGEYSKKDVLEARKLIVSKIIGEGLMEKEEDFNNNLSVCYRCNAAIEPLPSEQWFINVNKKIKRLEDKSLKEKAIEVVEQNKIKFFPDRFSKRYLDWMNNLHDWCISRQIWFGHQIPVWYKDGQTRVDIDAPKEEGWKQDQDTLDTWFSSGMWTFSTLGWPKKTSDLEKFHPTQVLETGYEIITLWVSRMVMMSLFALNEIPFEDVYLHGMILDGKGKKMSKSKGNGVDPVDVVDKFGADATRLSLLSGSTPGIDVRFSEDKVDTKRKFINKLWNISRYILSSVNNTGHSTKIATKTISDVWILGELNKLTRIVTQKLNKYSFSLASEDLIDFTWNKLADWYLEIAKIEKDKDEILVHILRTILKLWHPFIPFVTETIWDSFNTSLLMVEKWPLDDKKIDKDSYRKSKEVITTIQSIVQGIRDARSENNIEPKNKADIIIYAHNKLGLIQGQEELVRGLRTSAKTVLVKNSGEKIEKAILTTIGEIEVYISVIVDQAKEQQRLQKEKKNLEKLIDNQNKKLNNKEFINKAPQKIVETEQKKLETYKTELKKIINIIN